MAFIRVKKIYNNSYGYLVECLNTIAGPRQKVKQYLGRIHELKRGPLVPPKTATNKKDLVRNLVASTLQTHGFFEKKNKYHFENLVFSPTRLTLSKKNKEAILKINDGYLCSFTLQRILRFKKSDDITKDAIILAKHFLEAGLSISEEQFVQFYQYL